MDHVGGVYAGQAKIETLEADAEPLVIEAELMQEWWHGCRGRGPDSRRRQSRTRRFRHRSGPGLKSAAGEPHGEGVDMMIATGRFADFAHRRAAELAAPNDDRVVEQASLLQIAHQRRRTADRCRGISREDAFPSSRSGRRDGPSWCRRAARTGRRVRRAGEPAGNCGRSWFPWDP